MNVKGVPHLTIDMKAYHRRWSSGAKTHSSSSNARNRSRYLGMAAPRFGIPRWTSSMHQGLYIMLAKDPFFVSWFLCCIGSSLAAWSKGNHGSNVGNWGSNVGV